MDEESETSVAAKCRSCRRNDPDRLLPHDSGPAIPTDTIPVNPRACGPKRFGFVAISRKMGSYRISAIRTTVAELGYGLAFGDH